MVGSGARITTAPHGLAPRPFPRRSASAVPLPPSSSRLSVVQLPPFRCSASAVPPLRGSAVQLPQLAVAPSSFRPSASAVPPFRRSAVPSPVDFPPVSSLTLQDLRESPRRPGRYLLSLSDGRQLVVGVSVLADTGATRVGAELPPVTLERLLHEHTITDLADRALDYLARGRRTRRELELRLRKREATAAQIAEALDRLVEGGVLSDEDVARAEASARLRRGEAPTRVRQQLRRKGIMGATVTEAVAEAVSEDGFDERAACLAVAAKRAKTLKADDPVAARRKLLGFLLRRGYGGTVARSVIEEVLRS